MLSEHAANVDKNLVPIFGKARSSRSVLEAL